MIIKVKDGKIVHFFNNITELFSEYKVKGLKLAADPTEEELEEMLGGGIKITILGQYRLECIDIHGKIEVIHFNTEEDGKYIFTRYRSASDEDIKKLKDSFESITDDLSVEPEEFVKWFMSNLDKIIINPAHTGQICFDNF